MSDKKITSLSITVDDGSRRVPIYNTAGEEIGSFAFHPTDIGIIERFNRMAGSFDAITEPLEAIRPGPDGGVDLNDPKLGEALAEASRRLYRAVDGLFGGEGAAEAFFGAMNPFSPVDGEFYCTQVLQKVGEFISRQFETETGEMRKRVGKYLK